MWHHNFFKNIRSVLESIIEIFTKSIISSNRLSPTTSSERKSTLKPFSYPPLANNCAFSKRPLHICPRYEKTPRSPVYHIYLRVRRKVVKQVWSRDDKKYISKKRSWQPFRFSVANPFVKGLRRLATAEYARARASHKRSDFFDREIKIKDNGQLFEKQKLSSRPIMLQYRFFGRGLATLLFFGVAPRQPFMSGPRIRS